jgi:hypothetical protein
MFFDGKRPDKFLKLDLFRNCRKVHGRIQNKIALLEDLTSVKPRFCEVLMRLQLKSKGSPKLTAMRNQTTFIRISHPKHVRKDQL